MKKTSGFLFIFIFLFSLNLLAQQEDSKDSSGNTAYPLSGYKPIYLIAGNNEDQVKVQISFKYDLFSPYKIGLFAAYSQYMFWDLYEASSPFREINFNPDLFLRFESKNNFLNDIDLGGLDYFQLGLYEHMSNGKDEDNSRGWDRFYIQFQVSAFELFNIGFNLKYFFMYAIADENEAIQDHIGSFEAKFFIRYKKNKEEIYARFGAGGGRHHFVLKEGWQEYGIMIRPFFTRIRPYLQLFHGYGESMIDYDVKNTGAFKGYSIRLGIILE